MPYIVSTLTNSYAYTNWNPDPIPGQPRTVRVTPDGFKEQIVIKGGANLSDERFITPFGVRTEVTDRQLEVLLRNKTFLKHQKQGFIVVRSDKADADEVAKAHMTPRDGSAPYTPQSEIFNKDSPDEEIDPLTPLSLTGKVMGAVRRAVS